MNLFKYERNDKNMKNNVEFKTLNDVKYFFFRGLTNFPFVEQTFDAITTYELLSKIVEYLNKVIQNNNLQNENINELIKLYIELKNYIDNYFDNLNVQNEIDNKLNKMVEDGTLANIINQEIFEELNNKVDELDETINSRLLYFDNIELAKSYDFEIGNIFKTFGFYEVGDLGSSNYIITDDTTFNDTTKIELNNGLCARLISENVMNVSQFGIKGDNTTDDSDKIIEMIEYNKDNNVKLIFNEGIYIISKAIKLYSNTQLDGNNAKIKLIDNSSIIPFSLFYTEGETTENIILKNLIIDGNRINNIDNGLPNPSGNQNPYWSGSLLSLINLTNTINSTIDSCNIINSWGSGIWLNDCKDFNITNNILLDYRISGIAIRNNTLIVGTSQNININNNILSGGVVGIHSIFGCQYITITSNKSYNNKDSNRFPSYAYGGIYPNIYPLNCGFNDSSSPDYVSPAFEGDGAGIELTGRYTDINAGLNEYIIIDSNITYNNEVGIRLEEESRNCSITSNICKSNNYGIFIFSSYSNNISDNQIVLNNQGIVLEKLSNSVKPNSANAELNIISSNKISKNNIYGMLLSGASRNIISSNIISDNNVISSVEGGSIKMTVVDSTPSNKNIISSNQFVNYNGNDKYGINSVSDENIENVVRDNIFENMRIANTLNLNNNYINHNVGYRTDNKGLTYIPSGNNSVVVNHGVVYTPFNGEILVTPATDIDNNLQFYVGDINENTFTIYLTGNSNKDIYFNYQINITR